MKKGNIIIYIFGMIGLYTALLCCSYLAVLLVPYSSEYLAGLLYIVFYGLLFYTGNTVLCSSYLYNSKQAKIAYVAVFILEAIFFVFFNHAGAIFTVVSLFVAFEPIVKRQKQLKVDEQQQSVCVCTFCGQTNDADAVFCTNCGSGLVHTPVPKARESVQSVQPVQKNKDHKFYNIWMVLLPLGLCIFTACLCFRVFSESLPNREILTGLVRLENNRTGEEMYTNLIIIADESGSNYYVKGMINPLTGLKDNAESNWEPFGSTNHFITSIGYRPSYNVTVEYSDLQVSFIEKIESHPIELLLCGGSFFVSVFLLFYMIRQENHRMKS